MKSASNFRRLTILAIAALGTSFSGTVRADQSVTARFSMPVKVNGTVTETGCNNSPGPQVTLEGEILLGGLQVELIFQNNTKGTHRTTVTYGTNVVLVP